MKNKTKLLMVTFLALVLMFLLWGVYFKISPEIHYHAGFKVFSDGKPEDFSGYRYMHLGSCGEDVGGRTDEQIEKAHLHDGVDDVVHVHRAGALWQDLFLNIKFNFAKGSRITGYINGRQMEDILKRPIRENDSVVIFIGEVDRKLLQQAVIRERIIEVEKTTESC